VVTNVSADHLGLQGVDTVDQLAEVKAVVPRMTRKGGWAVLNGDDPRVFAMRTGIVATPWVFSRHPGSPAIREVLTTGGRATSVIDGWICVFTPARDPMPLLELVDVPMTLAGLSRFNVENALAATSAALALGIGKDTVVQGLRTFAPGPELNPGRMNVYSLDDTSVIIDLAHNEAGLEALLEIGNGLRRAGARLLLAMGTAGDRTDDILAVLSEIGARNSDVMVIVHKLRYMRGRTREELDEIYRSAAAHVGITDVPSFESELAGLQALVEQAHPGDVVAIMCHQDRELLHDWLIEQGATVDDPAALRAKVRRAHPGVTLSMD
jgi:cyanophycin synthetase